jgi:CheY-like chemotaxis protein
MACKLLLVDDSVTIRRVVELTFAGEDVNVVAVGDGREALERVLAERPDIVLADVGLAEPDGYEVATFVKRHPALSQVPVVLLTGAFQPVDRARAAECGCDAVLAKPFDLQSMVGVVRGLLHAPAIAGPADVPSPPGGDSPANGGTAAAGGDAPPTASASPDRGPDAEALIEWWASLLEEGGLPEGPDAGRAHAEANSEGDASPATPGRPAAQPAAGTAPLTLNDYFDLVDDLLAEPNGRAPAVPVPPLRFD